MRTVSEFSKEISPSSWHGEISLEKERSAAPGNGCHRDVPKDSLGF